MPTDRRAFINQIASGTAVFGGLALGLPLGAAEAAAATLPTAEGQGGWETKWTDRLTGRVRSVFDVPEIESAYGVWRASIWANQYEQALGIPVSETSTALVIRHNAIVLAMQQEFWDTYGVGKDGAVLHPLTGEPTTRNPALLGEADGVAAPFSEFALPKFQARGGVVLACDLALRDLIGMVAKQDGIPEDRARAKTISFLVPGVILQPSGVFAVLHAQQTKQALYIRAS